MENGNAVLSSITLTSALHRDDDIVSSDAIKHEGTPIFHP